MLLFLLIFATILVGVKNAAPIVQWIEQSRPKGEMCVRFVLGARQSS